MRRFLTLICLAFPAIAHAQQDTAFYDTEWKELPDRKNAAYFRPWPKEEDGKYKLVDYYISGKVQMAGYYKKVKIFKLSEFDKLDQYKDGRFEFFYANGKKSQVAEYKDGFLNGQAVYYDSTGILKRESTFRYGHLNGLSKIYYDDGTLWAESMYANDSLDGGQNSYYKDGSLKRNATYSNGKLVQGQMYDKNGSVIPFTPLELMPVPLFNVYSYLGTNIKYPEKARKKDIDGQVHVQFTVAKDGKIIDAKVVKSVHPLLDAEALRVVSEMPQWLPGKMDDEPVDVFYTLPVTFRLQ